MLQLIDQAFLELGASYNLNKYVGFSASYRIGNYLEDDDMYHIRHKWFGDIKGSLAGRQFCLFSPSKTSDNGKNIF